ncbi:hypothetical protein CI109_103192 [Kwoniella shandongensis]|uniref:Uncharacterized protein n=1 Tax=Kwoniella shandongensis TaxID=1734106 RepID=A0A5M6C9D5_9TREE|nr:uncharacterized protein CI109_000383 [Kwoniella shandongensis]KAA5531541.1 hypothetical protein CI109_000383 [Kwoniella shandongensis]
MSDPLPSNDAINLDLPLLQSFVPERTLSQSSLNGSVYLLGTINDQRAIVHLQRSVLPIERAGEIVRSGLGKLEVFLENQPYFSAHGFFLPSLSLPDLSIKLICPATETHIKKYSVQERFIVRETKAIYENVVRKYMEGFDESRLGWVYAILEGRKEAERVLYRKDGEEGFVILPDLKWDQTSMSSLYLTVLVQTRSIRTLRDLTPAHLPLLSLIRKQVASTVKEKFGVESHKLRLFVHYQPSYYHFHVHVVHIDCEAFAGMLVGQAHMLDDLISLLELSPTDGPSLLAQKTFTYPLGAEHGLYEGMKLAGAIIDDSAAADSNGTPLVEERKRKLGEVEETAVDGASAVNGIVADSSA